MFILDDILPIKDQEEIKKIVFSSSFPWYYLNDITDELEGYQKRPGFCHNFTRRGKVNSDYFFIVDKLIYYSEIALNKKFTKLLRARGLLQVPLSDQIVGNDLIDQFHVDQNDPFVDHDVLLYYVNDFDGTTLLSDTKCDDLNKIDTSTHNFNVVERVQGKQGRLLNFDGRIYHTATQPKKHSKCIININVV